MGNLRRLLVLFFALAALAGGWLVAPAQPLGAQVLPEDPRRGLVYDGLRASAIDSLCRGAFESRLDARVTPGMKQVICTHGPDPAPDGVDVRQNREPEFAAAVPLPSGAVAEAPAPAVPCYGTGTDGFRVQLLYARTASSADRFPSYASSFNTWAARLDQVVNDSAAETGGTRHVRFVTDSACKPVVQRVTLTADAMSSFDTMVKELHSIGYSRTDRKYLVWADTNKYCGIGEIYVDDRQDPTPGINYNNGNAWVQGSVGRIDNGCWGLSNMVEAHELLHLLGGVQTTSPNATSGFHCRDESDRLCYADGTRSATMRQVCPTSHESLYDCNHDDYFSTAPAPGSYLATHWNTADSAFLSGQAPVVTTTTTAPPPTTTTTVPPPSTTTTVTPTTTTTVPPTSTTTTTTLGPPATTTTTMPPPAGASPSAPQALSARQPTVGSGVLLAWQPPTTGPVTGYRIYRGSSPASQTLLATVSGVHGYHDASAGPSLHYYRVTAVNAAGEGPSSNLTGMVGEAPAPAGTVQEDVHRRLAVSELRPPFAQRWA